jgi:hypothetical protein
MHAFSIDGSVRLAGGLLVVAGITLALLACGDHGPRADRPCDPAHEACELTRSLPRVDVAPGEERDFECLSWTLDNDDPLWVHRVEFASEGAYHHSNWFFVPEGMYEPSDDRVVPCADLGFDELDAAVAGGVLFAQETQHLTQVQAFPAGMAVRLPPPRTPDRQQPRAERDRRGAVHGHYVAPGHAATGGRERSPGAFPHGV